MTALTPTTGREQQLRALQRFLAALVAREPAGLLEVRARRPRGGMTQRFHPTTALGAAARELLELGAHTDVYIGCAPRARRAGGRHALARVWVLWADCDDHASVARLEAFAPAPAILVRSGTGPNAHAYWPLRQAIAPEQATAANQRLAVALGACQSAVTSATAILRAPFTLNFKHRPPAPVTLDRLRAGRRHTLAEIAAALPPTTAAPARAGAAAAPRRRGDDDPLLAIAPAVYIHALTGLAVGRDRKIACPFHDDQTPSLHVYDDPADGWYCYGCRRGGTIYDFAAALYGITPRRAGFLELRTRLRQRFAAAAETGAA